ncbi:unnamed protein product, partial [Tetraodon nigroviridis]
MEERHKKILQRNRINLVSELEPLNLYDGLIEKGVFTHDMIDEIKCSGARRDQARQLVRDLETRGSRAFPAFLECLKETGYHSLAELLQNGAPTVQIQPPTPIPVDRPVIQPLPISPPLVPPEEPVSPVPKPSTPGRASFFLLPFVCQSYRMEANPLGHCLIINNVEFEPKSGLSNRNGSNVDCDRLERRFKALNFTVKVKTNLKQRQIRQELSALSKVDHSQYDCCVVVILSHGTEVSHSRFPGAVYGVDGQFVPVQHIATYLNGQYCPSLQGKPKLFFIQACGGDEKDTGFQVSPDEFEPPVVGADDQTDAIPVSSSSDSLSMSDEPDARASLPTSSDILVSYSTFPGYVSWRDPKAGSWYVETLDRVLEENAALHDLVVMLTMVGCSYYVDQKSFSHAGSTGSINVPSSAHLQVNDEVSQNQAKGLYKQMPGSFNFLRKRLYF